ncbi:UDP-N-acetylglucosamine 1-carboxyvinyltransferase [Candidatus Neomarinimicrobiota bacterium]
MEKIIINGNYPLSGEVKIGGAKNAVLPIMAASLIIDGITVVRKVPNLRDTRTMVKLLEIVGAGVNFKNHKLEIDGSTVNNPIAPYELVKTMRASFYVLGPLVARFGEARVSLPGGCAWGPRPVDYHLKGLEQLGAKITLDGGNILAEAKKLMGAKIRFDYPSVGATGNIVMAAVLAKGETLIENAAKEPEIVQLCEFLNSAGGQIEGVESSTIKIQGVDELKPAMVTVIPDRIEAGTFLIAGAALGEIKLIDIEPDHLKAVIENLQLVGAKLEISENSITIRKPKKLKPIDITTNVYPGYPTDLQAQWIALMTAASGSAIITDTVYQDRFNHIPELHRLGADIKLEGNTAIIRGRSKLVGAPVMSTDIRASAALILAGLMAEGRTEISRVYHIDRGYENIEAKFRKLGANIRREK